MIHSGKISFSPASKGLGQSSKFIENIRNRRINSVRCRGWTVEPLWKHYTNGDSRAFTYFHPEKSGKGSRSGKSFPCCFRSRHQKPTKVPVLTSPSTLRIHK